MYNLTNISFKIYYMYYKTSDLDLLYLLKIFGQIGLGKQSRPRLDTTEHSVLPGFTLVAATYQSVFSHISM